MQPARAAAVDPRIRRTAAVLADGRELFYFDDAEPAGRDAHAPAGPARHRRVDARALGPRPPTAQMRRDPLSGEWVSIAAARQHRTYLPPADLDPLAPQTPTNPSELPDEYDVAVFENRSPAFGPGLPARGEGVDAAARGESAPPFGTAPPEHTPALGASAPAFGRCEVVAFSPHSEGSLGTQPRGRIRTIVEAWAARTEALSALPGIAQVFPFENRGEAIGVTLTHPHGQIYAYPTVTPRTERALASALAHRERHGGELFADILAFERAGERVLIAGTHFTAFVPFAARWPIEVHVLPHRHIPDLAATSLAERDELAELLPRLLRGIDALYDSQTPYILAWHQAPVHRGREHIRLMLQLTSPRRSADKLKYLAGSEAAMGAWIGDIVPEAGAAALRAAIERADAAT
ncbi:MAG TPA: galactose-1-phosphate uridylyltransferase [Microbacteriaceae bacterium]|nr:galactose-1-phosphate uridylyltransferase [Microbacteriaceae bacterium]